MEIEISTESSATKYQERIHVMQTSYIVLNEFRALSKLEGTKSLRRSTTHGTEKVSE